MKSELEKVRNWAEARLRAGAVSDRSWPQYVKLVETIDGMLHDISLAENAPRPGRAAERGLRSVDQDDERVIISDFRQRRRVRSRY